MKFFAATLSMVSAQYYGDLGNSGGIINAGAGFNGGVNHHPSQSTLQNINAAYNAAYNQQAGYNAGYNQQAGYNMGYNQQAGYNAGYNQQAGYNADYSTYYSSPSMISTIASPAMAQYAPVTYTLPVPIPAPAPLPVPIPAPTPLPVLTPVTVGSIESRQLHAEKQITEAMGNLSKVMDNLDKKKQKAKKIADEQKQDIASVIAHQLSIQMTRIDLERQKKFSDLTEASEQEKAKLAQKAEEEMKEKCAEIDRGLEDRLDSINTDGTQQLGALHQATPSLQ